MMKFYSLKWLLFFFVGLLAAALFIRLGIWQLDRLEKRREFNSRVLGQMKASILDLNSSESLSNLYDLEYRQVTVDGEYDFLYEIAVRNQANGNQMGVHLVTPLKILGSESVILVDRGWIPYDDFIQSDWQKYAEPGAIHVQGILRRSKDKADFGGRTEPTPAPGESFKKSWFFINVEGIRQQLPYELVSDVYIQQVLVGESSPSTPVRSDVDVEISEGPHFSYAIQWFTFALIAIIGVPVLFLWQSRSAIMRKTGDMGHPINKKAGNSAMVK